MNRRILISYQLLIGFSDAITGALLLIAPVFTLDLMRLHAPTDALTYLSLHRGVCSLCRLIVPLRRSSDVSARKPLQAGDGLAAHRHYARQRGNLYCHADTFTIA